MRTKDLEIAVKKIMARSTVDENGCLIWDGCKSGDGYGQIRSCGKMYLVHRLIYAHFNGDPGNLCVCHACDNRPCVNPKHLWLGTNADNMRDRDQKGRRRPPKGEENGNVKLKDQDIIIIRNRYIPRSRMHGGCVLALEFGVSATQISKIVNYQQWKHL